MEKTRRHARKLRWLRLAQGDTVILHCHWLSLAAILGIYTVILRSLLSFSVKMTVSPSALSDLGVAPRVALDVRHSLHPAQPAAVRAPLLDQPLVGLPRGRARAPPLELPEGLQGGVRQGVRRAARPRRGLEEAMNLVHWLKHRHTRGQRQAYRKSVQIRQWQQQELERLDRVMWLLASRKSSMVSTSFHQARLGHRLPAISIP